MYEIANSPAPALAALGVEFLARSIETRTSWVLMNSRLFLDRGKVSAKLVGFAQGQRGCSSGIAKMPDRG
jgi:hypothetical protein